MLWFMHVNERCSKGRLLQMKELNTVNSFPYIHLKNVMDLNGASESFMRFFTFFSVWKKKCVKFPLVTGSAVRQFEIMVLLEATVSQRTLGSPDVSEINIWKSRLTLRLLISYIYGASSKARNANVVYGPTFGNSETVSFYLLRNVSTLNQCREGSCVTFVCKHFAS